METRVDNKCKAFTSLEQSRKLAEILPLESADMYYEEVCNLPKVIVGNYILHNQCMEDKDYKKLSNPVLSPAWSLAALLGVLPKSGKYEPFIDIRYNRIDYLAVDDEFEDKNYLFCYTDGSSLLDACYDMIIRLHELKML